MTEPELLAQRMEAYRARANAALEARLPRANREPCRLHQAMRYAVLNGGKRIRSILVYAAGEAIGLEPENLDAPACAVELIHAYSLVHDDLPAMDDDALRRGQPTCHRAFDEATALLAGDALQTLAFEVLTADVDYGAKPPRVAAMVAALAQASGSLGMAGGQAIDLEAVGRSLALTELETMHRHKTGALIRASVRLGALGDPAVDPEVLERLDRYACRIGLAFQIRDDILDVEGDTATLGKHSGADRARNKPTYPSIMGMPGAKRRLTELHREALECIDCLGAAARTLRGLAEFIAERAN